MATPLITADDPRLTALVAAWHEAGRARFTATYPHIDYDTDAAKRIVQRQKYLLLDEGTGGAFLLCRTTGALWRLQSAYGVPNKRKCVGVLGAVTGADLARLRWW